VSREDAEQSNRAAPMKRISGPTVGMCEPSTAGKQDGRPSRASPAIVVYDCRKRLGGLSSWVQVVTQTANIKAAGLWAGRNRSAVRALFMTAELGDRSSLTAHEKS
jgi:hypothetical protein